MGTTRKVSSVMENPIPHGSGVTVPEVETLDQLAESALTSSQPIKVRLQPQIYRYGSPGVKGEYLPWRGVLWTVQGETIEDVRAIRAAYDALHAAIAAGQIHGAVTGLRALAMGQQL